MKDNIFKNFKHDLPAGLVVFLVALPLCLGIAQASGAPPFSGIIAGVIGGIIVPIISKSKYGVSGPAAGLTVLVLAAITDLGFESFLVALVLAGIIQFLLGVFKLGIVGYFIPNSVIRGMLTSIGLILILKQIPHAVGFDTDYEGDFVFFERDGSNTFTHLFNSFNYIEIGAVIITLISIVIIVLWDNFLSKKSSLFKFIPSSLIVVFLGIIVNEVFKLNLPELAILKDEHLVNFPKELYTHDYKNLLTFPDFTAITNTKIWIHAVTIAAVASIETLLNVEASDKLDPDKNLTPTNAELKAQGLGNLISGLIGGIPLTQVIVRSSANIDAGAKSKMSAVYHGLLLLICVLLIPEFLHKIPLASLAAILLILGYKLASIKVVQKIWNQGKEQRIRFFVTVGAILFTDLLTGIIIGSAFAAISILKVNYELAYTYNVGNERIIITFAHVLSFLNKGGLMVTLNEIPENSHVIISGKKCHVMANDILELLIDFKEVTAPRKNITLEIIGMEKFGLE